MVKLQAFDLSYFLGISYFEDDRLQNSLVFLPVCKYLKTAATSNNVAAWKSKGLSDKTKLPPESHNGLAPTLNHISTKWWVKFDWSCLKQEKMKFTHKNVVNIYIFYEITYGQTFSRQMLHYQILSLELLSWLTMWILININILAMVLDMTHMDFFHYQTVVGWVKTYLVLI